MHDIGTVVWIILVVIGVISSMRKNARNARARRAAPAPPPQPQPQPMPASTGVHTQAFELPPVVVPPPVPAPARTEPRPQVSGGPKPSVNKPSSAEAHPTIAVEVRPSPIRGMFGGAETLVRAIVAAEVLGPPKSLQEQTIWSPRHSEPSI